MPYATLENDKVIRLTRNPFEGSVLLDELDQRIIDFRNPPPSKTDVYAERDRRLALGFDYDFGDARGVHRINTTPADMRGWDEVSTASQAMIALGAGATLINVATGTGLTQVTALEWQQVLLAAATVRQGIWGKSFALEAMDPIPADVTDDVYWT